MKRIFSILLLQLGLILAVGCQSTHGTVELVEYEGKQIQEIQLIPDPIEPVNRTLFVFNKYLFTYLLDPVTEGYKYVMPETARKGLKHFHSNIRYPVNLINNLLQGDWQDSWIETKRFGINTTVGFLGFRDSASDKYNIEPKLEDLGQTLGHYGWQPTVYLHLPVLGASTGRDLLGKYGDSFLDPASYWTPGNITLNYNDFSFYTDPLRKLLNEQYDPYEISHIIYSLRRRHEEVDLIEAPLATNGINQTLRSIFAAPKDKRFFRNAETLEVQPTDERAGEFRHKLPVSAWLQDKPAPLIFVLPGLGGHRLNSMTSALAELAYQKGYHVVSFSNPFNWEFIVNAPEGYFPGYTPYDTRLMSHVIREVEKKLRKTHKVTPGRSVMGYSMGAWYSLNIAADRRADSSEKFDKCIVMNPPADLIYGLKKLDELYDAPLKHGEKAPIVSQNALLKAVTLGSSNLSPSKPIPFSDDEASYLIGLSFRLTLRDMLFAAKYNDEWEKKGMFSSRSEIYRKLMHYSYKKYFKDVALPKIIAAGHSVEKARAVSDLRTRRSELENTDGIYLFLNSNDFLLDHTRLDWFRKTFRGRHHEFKQGGHLGNLWKPDVLNKIGEELEK